MAGSFYVGAYWGPRAEPVEACAARLSTQLCLLGEIDPLLAQWFGTGRSRKEARARRVAPSPAALRELLLAGRQPGDPSDGVAELGYLAGLWNGQRVEIGLRVRCGSSMAIPGMTSNSVSLQLPAADGAALALYRREPAAAVLRSVVAAWQPEWCTWTSHRLREAQKPPRGGVVAGWATYVADAGRVRADLLPPGVTAEPVDHGLLLVLEADPDAGSQAVVNAVAGALRSPA